MSLWPATIPRTATSAQPPGQQSNPTGAGGAFTYDELIARDKVNLDIFWLRDESLEDTANLPDPDVLARRSSKTCRPRWSSSARLPRT